MVNLTYLNDASVFHNLEGRYKAKLIHTCKLTFYCKVLNTRSYKISYSAEFKLAAYLLIFFKENDISVQIYKEVLPKCI